MEHIHKIPFLLSGFMAFIIGGISYGCGYESKTVYIRMAITLVVFYIIGIIIKNTINSINSQMLEDKRKKAEQEELLNNENKTNQVNNDMENSSPEGNKQPHKLNLVADDLVDDFEPLTINRVISSKLKE